MNKILILLAFSLSANYTLYAQLNLEEGLVAYYPFNGNANDESGNGFHGEIINNPTLIDGFDCAKESAYYFDGIDDYIEVVSAQALNLNMSLTFAMSVWVQAPLLQASSEGTVGDIISKWASGDRANPYPYTVRIRTQSHNSSGTISAGRFDGSCGNDSGIASSSSVNDGEWHNIIFQKTDSDSLELYIDGQLESKIEDKVTCVIANNENLLLGLRAFRDAQSIRPFTGGMDEIRLYNRTLNNLEIEALINKKCGTTAASVADVEVTNSFEKLAVSPNPVRNQLTILNVPMIGNLKVVVHTLIGQEILRYELRSGIRQIDLDNSPTGVLILTVDDGQRKSSCLFVKRK